MSLFQELFNFIIILPVHKNGVCLRTVCNFIDLCWLKSSVDTFSHILCMCHVKSKTIRQHALCAFNKYTISASVINHEIPLSVSLHCQKSMKINRK